MQIINDFSYNKPSFRAGLTKKFKNEINYCSVQKISKELETLNIKTDFKGNKLLAWCALQCTKLITEINNRYGLNLSLPKGIFVEDFSRLKVNTKDAYGFMNMTPAFLYSDKKVLVPEKTIFINEFKEMNYDGGNTIWDQVDELADMNFENKTTTTDFFLETFLHEFAHVMHEGNMQKNHSSSELVKIIILMMKGQEPTFQKLKPEITENFSEYATTNQLEMIACDLSKRIINCTSKETLQPIGDFTINSPYKKQNLFKKLLERKDNLEKMLKNTWNGILN